MLDFEPPFIIEFGNEIQLFFAKKVSLARQFIISCENSMGKGANRLIVTNSGLIWFGVVRRFQFKAEIFNFNIGDVLSLDGKGAIRIVNFQVEFDFI